MLDIAQVERQLGADTGDVGIRRELRLGPSGEPRPDLEPGRPPGVNRGERAVITGRSGRGPTRLISTRRMLISRGNSSMWEARRLRPIGGHAWSAGLGPDRTTEPLSALINSANLVEREDMPGLSETRLTIGREAARGRTEQDNRHHEEGSRHHEEECGQAAIEARLDSPVRRPIEIVSAEDLRSGGETTDAGGYGWSHLLPGGTSGLLAMQRLGDRRQQRSIETTGPATPTSGGQNTDGTFDVSSKAESDRGRSRFLPRFSLRTTTKAVADETQSTQTGDGH